MTSPVVFNPTAPMNPRCGEADCVERAEFMVEPVGEYDLMGWPQSYACIPHLGELAMHYAESLAGHPVQVTSFAAESGR